MSMTPFAFFFALALVLFAIELIVLQFSVLWIALFGLGALITALVAYFVPMDWLAALIFYAISSSVVCLVLIKPLRKWQSAPGTIAGNDAVGQRVAVISDVALGSAGKVHWSGTDWRAELAAGESLEASEGSQAEIVALSGITLYVKALVVDKEG